MLIEQEKYEEVDREKNEVKKQECDYRLLIYDSGQNGEQKKERDSNPEQREEFGDIF